MPSLPNKYVPAEHEPMVRERWESSGAFHADPARVLAGNRRPFAVFIPPPNVTDRLHLGHALNNTLQDVLVRAHRMMGFETLWMPGCDHAGIATQTVVEKRVLKETGRKRTDFPRDEFVAKIQAFKDEYEAIITGQLKAMGCSCDWARQRFTMDPVCARAVREAFFRLFKDRLIDRGKRLVNWDPVTQTALADDEVEMEEIDGHFYYLRYPLCHGHTGSGHRNAVPVTWDELKKRGYPGAESHPDSERAWVTVATTRPETYLGDTAVAVNPKDPRAKPLRGLHVELPLVGRVIPIIEDDYVVMPAQGGPGLRPGTAGAHHSTSGQHPSEPGATKEDPKAQYATGFLKVTPAHDTNDYNLWQNHKPEFAHLPSAGLINIFATDASISDKHGWTDIGDAHLFVGLSREAARTKVVEEFKARGLLDLVRPYRHSVGHSYRSHAAIEPYLSDQWYVKVTDDRLAGAANRALAPDQRSSGGTGLRPVPTTAYLNAKSYPPLSPPGFTGRDPYHAHERAPRDLLGFIRNLPHIELPGATYFVTWRTRPGLSLSMRDRRTVLESLRHFDGDRIKLFAACVMPDHVHAIVSPQGDETLGKWVASVKKFSAAQVNADRSEQGAFWQDERFDHVIRDSQWFSEFLRYVAWNPVDDGLCAAPSAWDGLWVHDDALAELANRQHRSETGATRTSATGAAAATDGQLRFHPDRYARTYESWHDNIRDWCISRQLWWGHRIPVWALDLNADPDKTVEMQSELSKGWRESRLGTWQSQGRIAVHERGAEGGVDQSNMFSGISERHHLFVCVRDPSDHEVIRFLEQGGAFVQDPDVLDTWFSSALWPMSTLGWPDPPADMKGLLEAFNPSSVLCTAREIITLWVSRMVMFNRYLLGEGAGRGPLPFKDVFIHSVIQDGEGRKMSKSLGNGVNPLDIIQSHGADAMRFILCKMTTQTQDVRMPVVFDKDKNCNTSPKFDEGRNFVTKVFNATRFVIINLESEHDTPGGPSPGGPGLRPGTTVTPEAPTITRHTQSAATTLADRWILSRLAAVTSKVNTAIREYDYSAYAEAMYQFLWWDFCDWYLEAIKPTVKTSPAQQAVVRNVLEAALRLLHPICPFVTEVLHAALRECRASPVPGLDLGDDDPQLCVSGWPKVDAALCDAAAEREVEYLRGFTEAIRQVRASQGVEPRRRITLHTDPAAIERIRSGGGLVETLAGLAGVEVDAGRHRPETGAIQTGAAMTPFVFDGREHALSNLKDAADPAVERRMLAEQLDKLDKAIATLEARLANPGYAERAPPKMVQETREQLAQKKAEREAAGRRLAESV